MDFSEGTVCWVDLMSPDPAKARKFYGSVFGWEFSESGEEHGGYLMCSVNGDAVAGIGRMPEGMDMPSVWTPYLKTPDVAGLVARIEAAGGQIVQPTMEVPQMGHMAIVTDPSGAVVGLWQPNQHHGFDTFGSEGAPCWFEVNTPDAAAVRDFFASLFELSPEKMEGMEYWTMREGEPPRWGVLQMTKEWEGLPPHWMSYFTVDNADAAVTRITEGGGKVQVPPFDTPFGRITVATDPYGAAFTAIQLPS